MPRKQKQWKPLDGAVEHSSFVLPSRTKKAIVIRKPDGAPLHFRSTSIASETGDVTLGEFPSISDHALDATPNSSTTDAHKVNNSHQPQVSIGQVVSESIDGGQESSDNRTPPPKLEPESVRTSNTSPSSAFPLDAHQQSRTPSVTSGIHPERHVQSSESVGTTRSLSKPLNSHSVHSNLDIYAHKYVPYWQKLVNESHAIPVYSPHLERINFDAYKSSFASRAFLPTLPNLELPPTEPCQIFTSSLQSRTYESFLKERLHNEYAAQQLQNVTFGLFDHPIRGYNGSQNLYQVKIPGVREYTPRIDLGDILLIRPLQPVLQGTFAQQAQKWINGRNGFPPGFGGIEHHAVVWSVMRRDEIVIVRLGQPLYGDPRSDLRCNVIIPLQAHKNAPAWRAIDLAAATLGDGSRRSWLHSMLFPEMSDGVIQNTLSRGTFDLTWYDESLNFEQKRAVQAIVNNDYGVLPYLISGPPGTGKTKTLFETAMHLISVDRETNITSHILMCAPSDAAADTLLVRLSAYLLPSKLFRLNNWTRLLSEVPGEVRAYCFIDEDTNLYSLPPFAQIMDYQIVVTSCRDANMLLNAGLSNDTLTTMTLNLLRTVSPSAVTKFPPLHWTALLLDEAAQATEPEALVPITIVQPPSMIATSTTPQIIMAGDEHQLGPRLVSTTILASSNDISTEPPFLTPQLDRSLFQRLFETSLYSNHPLSRTHGLRPMTRAMLPIIRPPFTNLIRNYRSHPAILSTSSYLFYADTLVPERPDVSSSILSWPRWPSKHKNPWPVMFIQNTSADSVDSVTEGDGTGAGSLVNRREASIALATVQDLLSHVNNHNDHHRLSPYGDTLREDDIIVLSPFRAQVTHLRTIFRAASLHSVRIGPLEAFQGLESRIVVICTTRTRLAQHPHPPRKFVDEDKARGLGVIDEAKRFNVAMTRAREGLIVIGSAECLGVTRDVCWRAFLGFVGRNGLVKGEIPGGLPGRGKGVGTGMGMGKLERALVWAEGLEREVVSEGGGQMNGLIVNANRNVNGNEKSKNELDGSFKFRLMGRMVDLDEKMWDMQVGDREEEEIRDEEDDYVNADEKLGEEDEEDLEAYTNGDH